jgi:predicted NUDIX family NTP pyrophosphohydrolase
LRQSAGILIFRRAEGVEVLLAHPGGPFWANRDEGAWTVPKGEWDEGEEPRDCALRELGEELGPAAPALGAEDLFELGSVRQKGGKVVHAWAAEAEVDPDDVRSNTFMVEWPPRSGECAEFPELDRVEWFDPVAAREKLIAAQAPFVDRLLEALDG